MTERVGGGGYEDMGIDPRNFAAVPRSHLHEMLIGKQIGRLEFFSDASRFASAQVGLFTTETAGIIVLAGPAHWFMHGLPRHFAWRLAWDWFDELTIKYRSLMQRLGKTRAEAGEKSTPLQRDVEGEMVLGVVPLNDPGPGNGEQMKLELSGNKDLYIAAEAGIGPISAGLVVMVNDRLNRVTIEMPGVAPWVKPKPPGGGIILP